MKIYPPGTRIAGQYEIAGRPLMGGMGIVYLCLDHAEDRPVALKTFKPEYLPDRAARDRFLREGTAWVDLGRHPHVVRCYGVERIGDGTEIYLVLELVAKEQGYPNASLRPWLLPGHPLPVEQALLFALQIARGMVYAVSRIPGFVHRDLKPENVLVGADHLSNANLPGAGVNRLRITDFGLAAVLQDAAAHTGELPLDVGSTTRNSQSAIRHTQLTRGIVGTPLYMAPEQWKGELVGVYTDVYALGCILYEMLAGQRAVSGRSISALQRAHCAGELRPLPEGLAEPVSRVVNRCLALEPGERYGDWEQVEGDLEAAYQAVTGRPAPAVEPAAALSRAERVAAGWSYSEMGASYLDIGKAEAALGYFERARQAGAAERERQLEAAGLTYLGNAYAILGDARRASGYYEQALAIAREIGDRRGEGADLGNLGVAYKNLGDARRAIGYHEQSLAILREIGDRRGEGTALGNLGNAYADLGDARRASGYYEQQLFITREIGDRRGEGNGLNNLGVAYKNLGDARRAIGYYEQSLEIKREIGDRGGEGHALGNLGVAYANRGDACRAIGYLEQALAIRREIGDINGVATDSFNMARLYAQQGEPSRALELAQEAARIYTQIGHAQYAQRAQQLIAQLRAAKQ